MLDGKSIDQMLTWFTTITNRRVSLGKPILNDQKVRKILRALLKSRKVKTTTLKELNDKEKMNFTAFVANLKTHEMTMKERKDCEPHKKIEVAFKASSIEHKKNCVYHLRG